SEVRRRLDVFASGGDPRKKLCERLLREQLERGARWQQVLKRSKQSHDLELPPHFNCAVLMDGHESPISASHLIQSRPARAKIEQRPIDCVERVPETAM